MAKMVPDLMAPDAPASERRVFTLLASHPDTRNWTVFHSLGLSSAYSGAYGEIDFVAAIPGEGLLCIEVKGGRVQCKNGIWTTMDRAGDIHAYTRSPFQQAREGMFKLLAFIQMRFGKNSSEARCPLGWMVIFTDSPSPSPSPDFERAELIDSRDLAQDAVEKLKNCSSLQQAIGRFGRPTAACFGKLVQSLRPDFDRVPTMSASLWDTEQRIISLTTEQYEVLDHVTENEHCLVHGGAGTGKTMLAVELARRIASGGKTVLLTCFNRELGRWLERQSIVRTPGLVTGSLHRLLRDRIAASEFGGELASTPVSDEGFYELAALAVIAGTERFDAIIIDEAQDFPAGPLLDVIEPWLSPSTGLPKSAFFADFSRQALYDRPVDARETLRRRLNPANFTLRRNCRNTKKVAAETELLTGSFETRASEGQPDGVPVDRRFYVGDHDQIRVIDHALRRLHSDGFSAEDILIIGPRRYENSTLAGVTSCGGFKIVDRERRESSAQVVYSTIQAFKGLESPAVILMDIEPQPTGETDALLYVAMTRARVQLIMILPENCRSEIIRRERENLQVSLADATT